MQVISRLQQLPTAFSEIRGFFLANVAISKKPVIVQPRTQALSNREDPGNKVGDRLV